MVHLQVLAASQLNSTGSQPESVQQPAQVPPMVREGSSGAVSEFAAAAWCQWQGEHCSQAP